MKISFGQKVIEVRFMYIFDMIAYNTKYLKKLFYHCRLRYILLNITYDVYLMDTFKNIMRFSFKFFNIINKDYKIN